MFYPSTNVRIKSPGPRRIGNRDGEERRGRDERGVLQLLEASSRPMRGTSEQ